MHFPLLLFLLVAISLSLPTPKTTGCYKGSYKYLFFKAKLSLHIKNINIDENGHVHGIAEGNGSFLGFHRSCDNVKFAISRSGSGNLEVDGKDDPESCLNQALKKAKMTVGDLELSMNNDDHIIGKYGKKKMDVAHTNDC